MKTVLIAISSMVVILVAAFFIFRKKEEQPEQIQPLKQPETQQKISDSVQPVTLMPVRELKDKFPLQIGSFGENVRLIQQALNYRILPKAATVAFQTLQPISENGKLDVETMRRINIVKPSTTSVDETLYKGLLKPLISAGIVKL